MNTKIKAQWLGHSAFRIESPDGKVILLDPFLTHNPKTPSPYNSVDGIGHVDYIFLTHGHEDHTGDTLEIASATGCKVLGIVELSGLLKNKGLKEDQALELNKGGSLTVDDVTVYLTNANHSASFGGQYAGDPAGLVLDFHNDLTLYHMGDTNISWDFALYQRLYNPDVVFAPMGDFYTMGPREAAMCMEMLKPQLAVPIHYGTFPPLTGTPEEFEKHVTEFCGNATKVIAPKPGDEFLPS